MTHTEVSHVLSKYLWKRLAFFVEFLSCFRSSRFSLVLSSLLDSCGQSVTASESDENHFSCSSIASSAERVPEESGLNSTTLMWYESVMQGMFESSSSGSFFTQSGALKLYVSPSLCCCCSDPQLMSHSICSSLGFSGNGSDISRSTPVFSSGDCSLTSVVAPVCWLTSVMGKRRKNKL